MTVVVEKLTEGCLYFGGLGVYESSDTKKGKKLRGLISLRNVGQTARTLRWK